MAMPPLIETPSSDRPMLPTLRRFLPYLWPAGEAVLKARIVGAMSFVVASKVVQVYGAAFSLKYAIDRMAHGDRSVAWLVVALVLGYAAARFSSTLFDNLRNAVFERVGQEATRRLASSVFRHLHQLSLRFHLERRTGAVTKVVERGTKSIDTMLYFMLFNIAPTILELGMVLQIFWSHFGFWLVAATLVMVALYITFTRTVTDWRAALRARMNDLDTGAVAHAVDSLLNFETVKYFGAEEREGRRYEAAMIAYANAAVKSENSLAWLNVGQSLITNVMLGLGMGLILGLGSGAFLGRRRDPDLDLAVAAVPPARPARHGLSHDPPGRDRHGGDVRPGRYAERNRRPARRTVAQGRARPCPLRECPFRL
jgi:ABC-type bacteriocin/lantibiotic exporter with double-glycine peptidase domain